MPLPDIQDLILTRLVECAGEIDPGINVKKFEPPEITADELPLLTFAVGPQQASPLTESQTEIILSRDYSILMLTHSIDFENFDESAGSPHLADTVPYIAKVQNYFWTHPLLQSDTTPSPLTAGGTGWTLAVLRTQLSDSGAFYVNNFTGIEFTLNVTARLVYQISRIA